MKRLGLLWGCILLTAGTGAKVAAAQQGQLWPFVRQEEGVGAEEKELGRIQLGEERFLIFYREAATDRRRVILTGQEGMIETCLVERIQAEGLRCWGKWVKEEEVGRPFLLENIGLF